LLTFFHYFGRHVKIGDNPTGVVYDRHMSRERIAPGGVVDTAIALIDREGFEALSLSAVAEVLNVRPSALYGHVGNLDQLRDRLAVTATNHLTGAVGAAAMGVAGADALDAMGHAYRGFAHGHPGQYSAILRPASAENLELLTANEALHNVFARVYLGAGLGPDAADLAAGSTRSAIHGFVSLEHAAGTTSAHDSKYTHLLRGLHRDFEAR
jgi:AcrR family transcriptional regulator